MHVPQVPDVQLLGIEMPFALGGSWSVRSSWILATPTSLDPRKNRTVDMRAPSRSSYLDQRPVCLLKTNPAFFIHLLNLVAPAPVRRMKSSRSSWAWMYPLRANVWSIQSSMDIKAPLVPRASFSAEICSTVAPVRSRSARMMSLTLILLDAGRCGTGFLGPRSGSMVMRPPLRKRASTRSPRPEV